MIQKKTKGEKKRGIKDKNIPQRPMSAFFAFLKQRKVSLTRENPDLSNTEIISVGLKSNYRNYLSSGKA